MTLDKAVYAEQAALLEKWSAELHNTTGMVCFFGGRQNRLL
jgi:hypothetical protein